VAAGASTSTHPGGLIVIADDDDEVRNLLAYRFEQQGYDVITAANGMEMIEVLDENETPTAIFVDLLMPGVLGGTVLDYIRSEPRFASVPTAVVTGSPELAPHGAVVFHKPVPFEMLLAFARGVPVSGSGGSGPNRTYISHDRLKS
jgi:CheY-like chemotaxis protein